MKVAFTARGDTLDHEIDERFGRAAMFVVVDTSDRSVRHVDNSESTNAAEGAGIQAARTVWEAHAEAVVTGHCGPKAFSALKKAGIDVYVGARGTVGESLAMFESGELERAESADVSGH